VFADIFAFELLKHLAYGPSLASGIVFSLLGFFFSNTGNPVDVAHQQVGCGPSYSVAKENPVDSEGLFQRT